MSNRWQGQERREHPRISKKSSLAGPAEAAPEISIVDLSLSGALIEVPSTLPQKSHYLLRLPLSDGGGLLEVPGEVVRSYVHGFDKDSSGRPAVRYRAAIQFLDLTAEKRAALEELVKKTNHTGSKI